ncbi:MAG: outer membrane protein assembly factor BamE domain-containing protein [Luteolibacter sp.]
MKAILALFPFFILALASCGVTSPAASDTATVKRGMTKEEIKTNLGTPAYQYDVNSQETWVYLQADPIVSQAKSTALNLVPIAGPLVSLATTSRPNTQAAKSAITFDKDGKVSRIEQSE